MVDEYKRKASSGWLVDVAIWIAVVALILVPIIVGIFDVEIFYRRQVGEFFFGEGAYPILGPSVAAITFGLMAVIAYSDMQGPEKYWEWEALRLMFALVCMAGFVILAVWRILG